MRLGGEACHLADRAHDPGGQDGTYAVDLGEGGTGSFHLGFDAPVQVRDLPVKSADVAQHLRGQPPPEAGRGAAPGPYGAQDARGPIGRELPPSATRSPRLSESRRSTSEAASESTCASLSLREAAKAVTRASSPSFLRALPAKLESTRTRAESFRRHVHHRLSGCSQPLRQVPTHASGVLHRPTTFGEPLRPAFEAPQAGAILREGSTLEELACGFVYGSDG